MCKESAHLLGTKVVGEIQVLEDSNVGELYDYLTKEWLAHYNIILGALSATNEHVKQSYASVVEQPEEYCFLFSSDSVWLKYRRWLKLFP